VCRQQLATRQQQRLIRLSQPVILLPHRGVQQHLGRHRSQQVDPQLRPIQQVGLRLNRLVTLQPLAGLHHGQHLGIQVLVQRQLIPQRGRQAIVLLGLLLQRILRLGQHQ
jgi:hypothetical protein